MSLKNAAALIKRANNFLITSHTNPEGDALGSELAFYKLIKALKKHAVIVNEDSVPCAYEFMPGTDRLIKYKTDLEPIKFDCFAVLDCSDLKRTGEVRKLNKEFKPVLNIDHHISNGYFGSVNWVEPEASCTCEMVYRLYKNFGVEIDKNTALFLYVGILTDTGSFRYSNTTNYTHIAAAELLKSGLNAAKIYKNVYGNIPLNEMKLLFEILKGIKCKAQGKIVWLEVTAEQLRRYKPKIIDLTDYTLNFARAIKGVETAVLFKENLGKNKEVRVNFRSQDKVDVNKIANFFGGGGHKTASGCTIQGRLEDIKKRVISKIEESLSEDYIRFKAD